MKFKFYITPVYPYGNDHYFHEIISLAEGLIKLGYTVMGNCNYWWIPETNKFLLKEDNEADFDVAVYDYRYVMSFEHLLFRKGYPGLDLSKKNILLDRNDWLTLKWLNPHYRIFSTIFSCDLRSDCKYPQNVKPWAFGLTERMMKSIDDNISENPQEIEIAHNYRVPHNLRKYLLNELQKCKIKYPVRERFTSWPPEQSAYTEDDLHYYNATTRRHNPDFYKVINRVAIFCAFGGYFETKPLRYQPYSFLDKVIRKPNYWYYNLKKSRSRDISSTVFLFQCDSFRLWEVFYSFACPLHIDYDYWNLTLPVKPINGEHFLGIQNLTKDNIENLLDISTEKVKEIGEAGRIWVKENYSPEAVAARFIQQI